MVVHMNEKVPYELNQVYISMSITEIENFSNMGSLPALCDQPKFFQEDMPPN
jgi:hypothetical protein